MKVWSKIKLKETSKDISIISNSLVNYLYKDNPIISTFNKYNVGLREKQEIEDYIADRVSGLLLLYFSKDTKRINDIVNKYNFKTSRQVKPELEGYIEK